MGRAVRMARSLLAAGALAFGLAGQAAAQVVETPAGPVAIDSGRVAGKVLPAGVAAWLGIPFAAPPVRENRWRPPQPVAPWSGVWNADRFAPECIQGLRSSRANHYFGEEPTSEDCLYLNVWAPPQGGEKRPVVVWIYGGGFGVGSSGMANYAGENLAKKGVVYVSLNYRVGPFGFLAHPALSAEQGRSGNYGMLDQVAALQWVQRNIARFGGDPGAVTIMGQSAGAMSVSNLQASPLARGLFHRAVGLSGSPLAPPGLMGATPTLAAAEQNGVKLEQALQARSLEQMRAVPADRVLQAAQGGYGPIVDGAFLPDTPAAIFAAGRQSDLPVLIGFTRDEGFNGIARAVDVADYQAKARQMWGDRAGAFLKLYPADAASLRRTATDAARDASVASAMHAWASAQSAHGKAPVFAYMFSRVQPYAPGITFTDHDPATAGAYHTVDVPYWLQTLESLNLFRTTRNWTDWDRALADQASDAVVAFVRTGDPSTPRLAWPHYEPERERIVELGDRVRVIAWPNREKLGFFAANPPTPPPPSDPPRRSRD